MEIPFRKLGEVCENLDSKRIPITKSKRVKGDVPYYGASGIVDYVKDYLFDEDLLLVSEDGANLLARTYPIAFSVNGKIWVNNHAHVLKLENITSQRFIEYYLNSIKLDDFVSGMAQPKLNQKSLKSIPVPFPSLEIQKQIVTLLDAAFAKIDQAKANIEKNIANAKELFQSKLNEIFSQKGKGWEERSLIEVNRFIDYRGKTPKKTDSGIKLITAKNVRMGYLKNKPEEFIAVDNYEEWMTRGIPMKGDVLFTTEAPLANVALLNTNDKIALAQRIITLCPEREKLSGEYLTYCLQSKLIQDKILKKGTGATVTGIKSKLLKQIVIPIPPKEIQSTIVNVLDQFKKDYNDLDINLNKKLQNLEELKKSLLQKAFAGELSS